MSEGAPLLVNTSGPAGGAPTEGGIDGNGTLLSPGAVGGSSGGGAALQTPTGGGLSASSSRSGGRKRRASVLKASLAGKATDFSHMQTTEATPQKKGWKRVQTVVRNAGTGKRFVSEYDVRIAALYIKDGLHGRTIGYKLDADSLRKYLLFHGKPWRVIFTVAALTQLTLALFEPAITPRSGALPSGSEARREAYTFAGVEAGCLAVYLCDLVLLWAVAGGSWSHSKFWRNKWAVMRMICFAAFAVDLVLALGSGFALVRFSRPLRPLMLIARNRNVRKLFMGVVRTALQVAPVLLVIVFHITFFSFLGTVIYAAREEGGAAAVDHFRSMSHSLYSLCLVYTSAPFMLVVMNDLWAVNPWNAAFLVTFVMIGNLFLFKLVIAVSYRSYKAYTKAKTMRRIQKRQVAFNAAFKRVAIEKDAASGSLVSAEDWFKVMAVLRPKLTEEFAQVMFDAVDREDAGSVPQRGFLELCALVNVNFLRRVRRGKGWLAERREDARLFFGRSVALCGRQRVAVAALAFDFLVLASTVQMHQVSTRVDDPAVGWRVAGVVILGLFCLEMLGKVFGYGLAEYLASGFNKLDMFCNLCGVVYYSYARLQPPAGHIIVFNLALCVRLLRVARFLNLLDVTRKVILTVERVMPAVLRLLGIFLAALYSFGTLGQSLYSDVLVASNPALHGNKDGEAWLPFASQEGFATFPRAFLTMFDESILAKWPAVMNAAAAATDVTSANLFFFCFRVSVAMLFLPVFVGFVIDAFVTNFAVVEAEFVRDEAAAARRLARENTMAARRKQSRAGLLLANGGGGGGGGGGGDAGGASAVYGTGGAASVVTVGAASVESASTPGADPGRGVAMVREAGPSTAVPLGHLVDATVDSPTSLASPDHKAVPEGEAKAGDAARPGPPPTEDSQTSLPGLRSTGGLSAGTGMGEDDAIVEGEEEDSEESDEVERGLARKNSDVAYAAFSVSAALEVQDMERIVREHKQQAEEIAAKDRRIQGQARSLLKQKIRCGQLEQEVARLQDELDGVDVPPPQPLAQTAGVSGADGWLFGGFSPSGAGGSGGEAASNGDAAAHGAGAAGTGRAGARPLAGAGRGVRQGSRRGNIKGFESFTHIMEEARVAKYVEGADLAGVGEGEDLSDDDDDDEKSGDEGPTSAGAGAAAPPAPPAQGAPPPGGGGGGGGGGPPPPLPSAPSPPPPLPSGTPPPLPDAEHKA